MKRQIAILILTLVGMSSTYASKKYALLIGISEYPTQCKPELTWNSIHGANDVDLMKGTLTKQGFVVTTIKNQNATANKIRSALNKLISNCHIGDMVYIHFSGHGQAYEDLSGDEIDGWDETIVPYDAMRQYEKNIYDGRNHILDDELENYLSSIRFKVGQNGYVYLVLDACHIGGASRGEEDNLFIRGTDNGFTSTGKKYIPKIDRRSNMHIKSSPGMGGICILEACRSYQTNSEIKQDGRYYGSLSYYVYKILSEIRLTPNTSWIESVRNLMDKDKRLKKQNMVIEKSD